MKQVKDLMTKSPVTCKKTDNLKDVVSQMEKNNIGFLPVIDESGKAVGTITDRDITLAIGKMNKAASDIKVSDAMNSKVVTISSDDDLSSALKLMRTEQIGRLPVVDTDKRVNGIVTLVGLAGKIKDVVEQKELEATGKENLVKTLYALAERDKFAEVED